MQTARNALKLVLSEAQAVLIKFIDPGQVKKTEFILKKFVD